MNKRSNPKRNVPREPQIVSWGAMTSATKAQFLTVAEVLKR